MDEIVCKVCGDIVCHQCDDIAIAWHASAHKRAEKVARDYATMRRCSRCFVLKPLVEYHRDPSSLFGRRADCKHCRLTAMRNTNAINKFIKWRRERSVK